jgi:hypothetical protein
MSNSEVANGIAEVYKKKRIRFNSREWVGKAASFWVSSNSNITLSLSEIADYSPAVKGT